MKPYRLCWELHKWIGVALSLVLINISITGLLLLEKKNYKWIQPATRQGQEGLPADFVTIQATIDTVLGCNHPDFANLDAINRIEIRPGQRVYKILSKTNYAEIQIDAVTGQVLNIASRRSDLLEQLHDGSLFSPWIHGKIMPTVAVANIVLVLSGLYLWLGPKLKKK